MLFQILWRALRLHENSYESIKVRRVYITDSNDAQVGSRCRVDGEAGTTPRQLHRSRLDSLLHQHYGNLMLANGEEQQSRWVAMEIGHVCTVEHSLRRQVRRIRQVEAERKAALKPWFDRMPIAGTT